MVAKIADLQRQIADYQTFVSSLSQRLDDVTVQLNDSHQQLRDSGRRTGVGYWTQSQTFTFCSPYRVWQFLFSIVNVLRW